MGEWGDGVMGGKDELLIVNCELLIVNGPHGMGDLYAAQVRLCWFSLVPVEGATS